MINLNNERHIARLYTAMDSMREAKRPFINNRQAMLEQFVGSMYSTNGAKRPVLVNLLAMTADVYTIGLAAQNPRVRVITPFRDLWSFAYRWQHGLNNYIKEIRFAQTTQAIVLDAFFSRGIAKVFQAETQLVQLEDDVWADPGRPYIGRISPDDFGLDMSVKDIRRCHFMWDEYRVSWESVQENPHFDKDVVAKLNPTSKYDRTEQQANDISAGAITDDDEYTPMIDLQDVWLPETKQVAIFPRHVQTKPLQVLDEGPEGGPYHLLSFADVPDNTEPASPAQNLYHLHVLYNQLARKQSRQALRQKTNPTYRGSGDKDAQRLQKVNDGDWLKVNDPSNINVITQGGVDQPSVAFSLGVLELFDRQAGNLQAMAGLGPQAPTATQERMIGEKVGRKEAKMQSRVHTFAVECLQSLGHLMWHDGMLEVPASYEYAPGTGVHIDAGWTPEQREGDFPQYNFDIELDSMTYEPREVKIQKIERALDRALQLYPLLEAAGGSIDVQELIKQYAAALSIPELENIITFANPPAIERPGPAGGNGPKMPANTTRNYVRQNVPTGGTPQSRTSILQQAFLGGGQTTPQQRATMPMAGGP